jgi:hypothetical protein
MIRHSFILSEYARLDSATKRSFVERVRNNDRIDMLVFFRTGMKKAAVGAQTLTVPGLRLSGDRLPHVAHAQEHQRLIGNRVKPVIGSGLTFVLLTGAAIFPHEIFERLNSYFEATIFRLTIC